MYERPEVLTRLHVYEEYRHHQVETGGAKADSVDSRVADQHLTVASTMCLVTHHVEERHLKHTHTHTHHIYILCSSASIHLICVCFCVGENFMQTENQLINFNKL